MREIFEVQAPEGAYIWRGDLTGFFLLPVWGAYIWMGLFSEFYGMSPEISSCSETTQHLNRSCFVSSCLVSLRLKERDMLHIHLACFSIIAKRKRINYTVISLVLSPYRLKNDIYYIHSLLTCDLTKNFERHDSGLGRLDRLPTRVTCF